MEALLEDLRLDPGSPVPLYYQLREILRERLERGVGRPGDRFPTETEICRITGLSRMTVRHALQELKAQGLLAGRRGAGTSVSRAAVRELVQPGGGVHDGRLALRSFTEFFRSQGQTVGSRVLSKALVDPPDRARAQLGLAAGEQALEVRRIRLVSAEPVSLETSYYPQAVAGLLQATDLEGRSVYEVWSRAGVIPEEAVETVELSIITPFEAKTLEAPAGIPVALCRRTTYDPSGRPIEFTKVVYRGDKHRLTSHLRRPDLSPGGFSPE